MDAHNNISNFPDDFPIAGLTVKQFIELCVSLGFGNRSNSHPNKPESPPPDVYSETEYSTYFQRIILLPNVAVDFSVDLTVNG